MDNAKLPRRRTTRQAPEVRRQDLLAVTISCLATLGPRGTTGREICRRAGVSHGLLRHYFTNPSNLLLETYQDLCDTFIARFRQELAVPHPDPWQALERHFMTSLCSYSSKSEAVTSRGFASFSTIVMAFSDQRGRARA